MATAIERLERLDRLERIVENLVNAIAEQKATLHSIEYYEHDEPARIPVTTAPGRPYEFKEKPVDFLWLYAAGTGIQVSLDKAVSGESFVIPNGAILSVKKRTRRVYGIAQIGTGSLYIWGFYAG